MGASDTDDSADSPTVVNADEDEAAADDAVSVTTLAATAVTGDVYREDNAAGEGGGILPLDTADNGPGAGLPLLIILSRGRGGGFGLIAMVDAGSCLFVRDAELYSGLDTVLCEIGGGRVVGVMGDENLSSKAVPGA